MAKCAKAVLVGTAFRVSVGLNGSKNLPTLAERSDVGKAVPIDPAGSPSGVEPRPERAGFVRENARVRDRKADLNSLSARTAGPDPPCPEHPKHEGADVQRG